MTSTMPHITLCGASAWKLGVKPKPGLSGARTLPSATIPPSAFFSDRHRHHAENHVRFAFCKSDDTLEQAAERMRRVRA